MSRFSERWVISNRKAIIGRLQAKYGEQWRSCFPPRVQQALFDAEVLNLIRTQALADYEPAQELARAIYQDQTV